MRIKQYYSPEEIITNQYTNGQEYMTLGRKEYVGLYHRYLTGEIYTEAVYSKKSKKLIIYIEESNDVKLYKKNNSKIKTKYQTPSEYSVQITNKDIKKKSITRNILKNVSSNTLQEVSADSVKLYNQKKIDNNLYQLIKINWTIAGPLNTTSTGQIIEIGAVEKNIQEVQSKAKKMPELLSYFKSFAEFYVDDTYIVPASINSVTTKSSSTSQTSTSSY